jgi:hypothetical protein
LTKNLHISGRSYRSAIYPTLQVGEVHTESHSD